MINIHLPPEDIVNIRFAYSPLVELVIGYRMLRHPAKLGVGFAEWTQKISVDLQGVEFPYIDAVMTSDYIADFLLRTPLTSERQIGNELQRVRETPEDHIRMNMVYITHLAPLTPIRQLFLDAPSVAMEGLIQELTVFWEHSLADHWHQMIPVLDNEILHRARVFAIRGAEASLNEIARNTRFKAGVLQLEKVPSPTEGKEHFLQGEGIQLVPSLFKTQSSSHIRGTDRAMLLYPAYGIGTLQNDSPSTPVKESLMLLMGERKTDILTALTHPQSTQELARNLHLSASAISQHLQRLHEAGVVESYRSGYYVFYRLSTRGEKLLELFDH